MANQENEIQKMYEKLKTRLSDERIDLLRRYFEAANNFYKIIPLKRLLRIINSQNSEPYNEADFLEYVEILQSEEHFFAILGMEELFDDEPASAPINRLLIHESLPDFDDYSELLSSKKGRIYFVPEKEALLAYENEFYHENTPQYSAMSEFCEPIAKISSKMTIEDLMDELLFIICGEDSDPWWNVSAENQASDRAYRIGQKNNVQIYKLITRKTIEEKIRELQQAKSELADIVLYGGDGSIMNMTTDEILELLG